MRLWRSDYRWIRARSIYPTPRYKRDLILVKLAPMVSPQGYIIHTVFHRFCY